MVLSIIAYFIVRVGDKLLKDLFQCTECRPPP
jgi:hypothetical protein